MPYLLATTESRVRWYSPHVKNLDDIRLLQPGGFDLLEVLDLKVVTGFGNKGTAKTVALALGLKTWRYVKFDSPNLVLTIP